MATIISKYVKQLRAYVVLLAAVGLCACDPNAKAYTKRIEIDINVQNISAGFVQVEFSTNREAFYLVSMQPAKEGINPQEIAKTFMLLALDSAYLDYLKWRNNELQNLVPFVADFSSHSLQYGNTNRTFCFLQPDTDYWIFAFGVDPESNKPFGQLFLKTITTKQESVLTMDFQYRVRGEWDYVYPKDTAGVSRESSSWRCFNSFMIINGIAAFTMVSSHTKTMATMEALPTPSSKKDIPIIVRLLFWMVLSLSRLPKPSTTSIALLGMATPQN